jgi:uncharacterized membrane protein YqjE
VHDANVEVLKEQSIPQLLRQLSDETTTLLREEIELAKVELDAKLTTVAAGATLGGVAAIFALGAFAALTTAIIAALALVIDVWAAALIVAVVYGVIAAIVFMRARQRLRRATPLVPQHTAQSVKDDIEWVKTRAQSSRK